MTFFPLLFADEAISAQPIWIVVAELAMLAASAWVLIAWQRSNSLGRDFFGPRDIRSERVKPWGQVVLFGFLSMILVGLVLLLFLIKDLQQVPAEQTAYEKIALQLYAVRWGVVGNLVTLAVVLGFSYWQVRITAGEIVPWRGLLPNRRDLRDGVLLGVACIPLLLLLQGLLQALTTYFFNEQTEHPYIEMIRKSKDLDKTQVYELLGWITFSVTFIAPILEEILFRGLLQGWLRGKYHAMTEKMLGAKTQADVAVGPETDNPYQASQVRVPLPPAELQRQRLNSWAPIFIASTAFAAAHAGHGPAPIPLFFFSLALGYVYEKTGRLAPSIIAHLLLNLCTSIMLWVVIMYRLPWD